MAHGEHLRISKGRSLAVLFASLALTTLAVGHAAAQRQLVMYCGVDEKWCRAVANTYQKETGVQVDMTRMSAGEVYARVRAEKDNPHGDVWFGGTGDPHLQAAEEGVTESYQSPMLPKLRDWAQRQAERSHNRTVGLYLGALGFGYNTEDLKKRKMTAPACWADLIKPDYKGEVQMADPNSSGTAWTMLATIVQLMGEDKAFDYMKALHRNINEYTKAGAAPALATGPGRDACRHRLPARPDRCGQTQQAGRRSVAMRGHRLRDRLAQHDRRRQAHGRSEEVLRLGADAGDTEDRGDRPAVSRFPPIPGRRCRPRRRISPRSS